MRFIADENIDKPIVESLRQHGHEVFYVLESDPGISDEYLIPIANQQGAILLTADKDFGELVFRQKKFSKGVILIRLAGFSPKKKAEIITRVIQDHEPELPYNFTVISSRGIRIRK